MEKAFELKALVEKLKANGLELAEDAAKLVIVDVLDWAAESVALTENKFDDIAVAFLPQLKAAALEAADKIDGSVG
jgi:hypothetical protein